jgi:periodic tryptophan protein 2
VLLLMVGQDGQTLLVNLPRQALLHHFNFKTQVAALVFSPCGRFFAVSHGKQVHVWHAPGRHKTFAPFVLYRKYTGHHEAVTSIDWAHDSRFFAAGSVDTTVRIFSLQPIPHYRPVALTAHRDKITAVFFAHNSHDLYTVSRDGVLLHWHAYQKQTELPAKAAAAAAAAAEEDDSHDSDTESDTDGHSSSGGSESAESAAAAASEAKRVQRTYTQYKWGIEQKDKHYFKQHRARVISAVLHKPSNLLVAGFSSGVFGLYELPVLTLVHSLSISQKRLASVAVNASGEWLAFGSPRQGQLLVWEWQSESYILKQQGHSTDMNVLAYSPDGQTIASGGDDGKVVGRLH